MNRRSETLTVITTRVRPRSKGLNAIASKIALSSITIHINLCISCSPRNCVCVIKWLCAYPLCDPLQSLCLQTWRNDAAACSNFPRIQISSLPLWIGLMYRERFEHRLAQKCICIIFNQKKLRTAALSYENIISEWSLNVQILNI